MSADVQVAILRTERRHANERTEQRTSGHERDVDSWLAGVSYEEWFALVAQRDALAEALREIAERRAWDGWKIARAALAEAGLE